jgi:hypothetical protein
VVKAVQLVKVRRLFGEPQDLGNGHLHPERQLIRLDSGPQRGVVGILHGGEAVQAAQQLELIALLFPINIGSRRGEGKRVFGVDRELDAIVLGAEVTGAMAAQAAAAIGDRRTQNDEPGQVVIERAKPVMDPRAHSGKLPLEHMPAGVELQLRSMVVVSRPHRADHGDVVDTTSNVGPPVAYLDAALSPLAMADLHRKQGAPWVVQALDELAEVLFQKRRIKDVLVGRLLVGLAGVEIQRGLGIKALKMARPTDHEQPDHVLRPGREMRPAVGRRPDARRYGALGPSNPIAIKHRTQDQSGEPHAHVGQEGPSWQRGKRVVHDNGLWKMERRVSRKDAEEAKTQRIKNFMLAAFTEM